MSIQHWPFETFPYLSNLHTLGSNNANLLSLNRCHHDNGSHIPYALVVSDNSDLITIDLSSLQEIQGGSVYLHNNKQLCLIGNFTSLLTNTSSQVCITKEGRREPQECGEQFMTMLTIRVCICINLLHSLSTHGLIEQLL